MLVPLTSNFALQRERTEILLGQLAHSHKRRTVSELEKTVGQDLVTVSSQA